MYRFLGSVHGGNTVENIRSNFAYKIAHNLRLCTTTINSVVVLHYFWLVVLHFSSTTLAELGSIIVSANRKERQRM